MSSAPPLSHHDIVALVAPFARRGRHVDLAASDRAARRLVFKPPASDDAPALDAPRETLELDARDGGSYRLTRRLTLGDGQSATLTAQGSDLDAMLAAIEAVPHDRHVVAGDGFVVVRSYVIDDLRAGRDAAPRLTEGCVRVDGLLLTLAVPGVRRVAADIALEPIVAGPKPALPEDLLAVLGWNWARLVPVRQGWTSKLRLRGDAARRTAAAEAALDLAAAHLARTLAEPPACYHERLRPQRWQVFLRRGIPTLTALSLFGAVGLFSLFWDDVPMRVWVAMYHVPTVIVAISFLLQELPRFEIPPWPRPLRGERWREVPAGEVGAAALGATAP